MVSSKLRDFRRNEMNKTMRQTSRDVSSLRGKVEYNNSSIVHIGNPSAALITQEKDDPAIVTSRNWVSNRLPANIDEVRVLNKKDSSLPQISTNLLEKVEEMEIPSFKRLKDEKLVKQPKKDNKIELEKCNPDSLFRSKISISRLEAAQMADWFSKWVKSSQNKDTTSQSVSEIKDVIMYCGTEFKKHLEENCSNRALLYQEIWGGLVGTFEKIQERVLGFLSNIDEIHMKHTIEMDKNYTLKMAYETAKLNNAEKHLKERESRIEELVQMIRILNNKLGTSQYALKQLREDLRSKEEVCEIIKQENETISDIFKSVKKVAGSLFLIQTTWTRKPQSRKR